MAEIIELGLETNQILTYDQCVEYVRRRAPETGIILADCPCGCGSMMAVNFGNVSRKDALWLAEQLKNYALGFDTDECSS